MTSLLRDSSQMLFRLTLLALFNINIARVWAATCTIKPLGNGLDDTDQVENAIKQCGASGTTVLQAGTYNITRKLTWNLTSSRVDIYGQLSFKPDIQYWLNPNNTYRVVFIQNQASWFVITGTNFVIDGHDVGGINGNGQPWWTYFAAHTKADGDGRPISFTLSNVQNGTVNGFRVEAPPFWCNTVADSKNVVYNGMFCNATNADSTYAGRNVVPNTDGINTYRSDNVSLLNWDITCGDDCLAIKGNSTNILVRNVTCRGGNGVAIGSLGQYSQFNDIVENVLLDNLNLIRLDSKIQPNLVNGVYLKTWTGTTNGSPPTGGGGGGGRVKNLTAQNVRLDRVSTPVHLYQTNGGHSGDAPSKLQFSDLSFKNWSGSALTNKIVDLECSSAVPCPNFTFDNFNISPPSGQASRFICINVVGEVGLPAPCNSTGLPKMGEMRRT